MPERSAYHHGNLRQELIRATLELVGERGVGGFTVAEAARRTGVSPGAPYRHFPDREALLAAAAKSASEQLATALVAAIANVSDPVEQLAAASAAYVRFVAHAHAGYDVIFAPGLDRAARPELVNSTRGLIAVLFGVALELSADAEQAIDLLEGQIALSHGFVSLLRDGFYQARAADPDDVAARAAAATRSLVKDFGATAPPPAVASGPPDLKVPGLSQMHARRSEKWAVEDDDVLSLTVAEMDFPVAASIREAVQDAVAGSDLGYATPVTPELSAALAGFAKRRLRWAIDPEQVTVVPDVMVGLVELCRLLVEPGAAVAFASPAYPPFFVELREAQRRLVTIGLDPTGRVDLDALDRALAQGTRALVLANPHNPTGRVLALTELQAIAERCASAHAWVLADEIHAPLVLPGATHNPWLEVSDAARACGVAFTSASKAFNLAALKTAFAVTAGDAPRDAVGRLGPQHDHASVLGAIATEIAFRECDEWLDTVIGQLDRNRAQLARELADRLPEVRWAPPEATYLAWLDCRRLSLGDDPAAAFLRDGRVALGRGLDFGPEGAGHVRLNFATSPAHLSDATGRMVTAISRSS